MTYLPLNAQDWSPYLEVATRVDISQGTLQPADAALAASPFGGEKRLVAVWADERSETPEAYMRTFLKDADSWYLTGSDNKIPFGRDSVERIRMGALNEGYGVIFESSTEAASSLRSAPWIVPRAISRQT